MAEIKIHTGQIILVSDCDLETVSVYKWRMSSHDYPRTTIDGKRYSLHRFLMNPENGLVVDHIDGNTLNNKRENLRVVPHHVNSKNVRTSKGDMQGVFYDSSMKRKKRWIARTEYGGVRKTIGRFLTKEEAASAYRDAQKEALAPWEKDLEK